MALLSFLFLLLAVSSVLSGRIAGFHTFGGSQYINTRHTLEELARRGHEVNNFCYLLLFTYMLLLLSEVPSIKFLFTAALPHRKRLKTVKDKFENCLQNSCASQKLSRHSICCDSAASRVCKLKLILFKCFLCRLLLYLAQVSLKSLFCVRRAARCISL